MPSPAPNQSWRPPLLSTLILLAAMLGTGLLWSVGPASAQNRGDQQEGWVNDVNGLRHFSGMRCPDIIGRFYRTKVLATHADRMAGCIYTGRDGMTAVLRQHLSGTGHIAAETFLRNYKEAGFKKIAVSGIAANGLTFMTRPWGDSQICETLWHFSGSHSDYTLWLEYSLPAQEADVAPAVSAFAAALSGPN